MKTAALITHSHPPAPTEAVEVAKLAHMVPDLEPQIPQRMQQALDEALFGAADRAAEQHEQIDVGVEKLGFAPVTADRVDGERSPRMRAGILDELADDAVDTLGVARERLAAAFSPLCGVDELGPCLVERGRETDPQLGLIDVSPLNGAHRHP